MGSVRHDIRSEGRGREERKPANGARTSRLARSFSTIGYFKSGSDAHGTKGGAGDRRGREGGRRRKTLRAALKRKIAGRGTRRRLAGPGFRGPRERPISGVFRVSIAPIHLICDQRQGCQRPVLFLSILISLSSDVRIVTELFATAIREFGNL